MKYICLGYMNDEVWETLSESERNNFMDECFGYDDELRKNGHLTGGEGLREARNAATLRWQNGKVSVTDGPFAETKEQIGGIMMLEATDLNHAIRLLSKHPSLRLGRGGSSWEIRPAVDLAAFMEESKRRGS
ncbi:MAG: dehydrogenase [Cytophagaceae bacterium SCN 52-12]|nr:MAG: dehydrogenase [Cytophagaceae bacterium SCN 52-12]